MPSIETSVASVVFQASTAPPPPGVMVSGVTEMVAVGAGEVAAGGGGGGGGTAFLWQPATRVKAETANREARWRWCRVFTFFSSKGLSVVRYNYFQLQFGME